MSSEEVTFHGSCHCGNLELTFETELKPAQLPVRACSCSFCRRHGVRTTCDPQGKVKITVHDSGLLHRYRFGMKTADFLICKRCGIYVGAVIGAGDKAYATVNINTFDDSEGITQEPISVTYEGETAEQRRVRRAANWTPVVGFVK